MFDQNLLEMALFTSVMLALVYFGRKRLFKFPNEVRRKNKLHLMSTKLVADCGHTTRAMGWLHAHGRVRLYALPLDEAGKTRYCHKCLSIYAKQCMLCGRLIVRQERISLQPYDPEMGRVPKIEIEGSQPHVLAYLRPECTNPVETKYLGELRLNSIRLDNQAFYKLVYH